MPNISHNSIGFILLTHAKPLQIYRLIDKLNSMFNYPLIFCHHDFDKCDLSRDKLSKNVLFVRPHLQTKWGEFSIVEATVQALKLMYEVADAPDWFILLSGADYPLKSARQILDDLTSSPYDAYIQYERITYKTYKQDLEQNMLWLKNSYKRYCTKSLSCNYLKNFKISLEHPLLTKPLLPFSKKTAALPE